ARFVHWLMTVSPSFYTKQVGTCGLTFIEGSWYDHFFPIGPTSIAFSVGASRRNAVVVNDKVEIKRQVNVSGMADNFVISGLTGAKVAKDFKDLLESASFVKAELTPEDNETTVAV